MPFCAPSDLNLSSSSVFVTEICFILRFQLCLCKCESIYSLIIFFHCICIKALVSIWLHFYQFIVRMAAFDEKTQFNCKRTSKMQRAKVKKKHGATNGEFANSIQGNTTILFDNTHRPKTKKTKLVQKQCQIEFNIKSWFRKFKRNKRIACTMPK